MMTADSLYNTAINSVFYALVPAAMIAFNRSNGSLKVICSFIFFASIIPMEVTILKRIMSNSSESIIVDEAMGTLKELMDEKPMEYKGNEIPKDYNYEFKGVSFRYADDLPLALDNVNITIKEGEYFDEDSDGSAMISYEFAELNSLKVGDKFKLKNFNDFNKMGI